MRTISQRELRNDNAAIIRGIESGESYTVTRRGVPVARLTPYDDASSLRCVRPARQRVRYSDLARVTARTSTQAILDEIRGER
ncbi:MAG: type II toxin-antitoxin system prevent-host-death family antitoxin [Intrasporangium sp.]|uniref:type II toxin-antitoxin system Phd/YefM family antitoxin n=1 Tax=Intrasporangium sp. TaxID=1925024 RepID=UPI00264A42F4|nr:type II toxin-antitoxin system prevent-host-death family antitoxin [Intrasporangium sp.]MDN5797642.1 type II toxin-antitoxin system prevent-host-death family antitoxin [Intrasporangium sp.]